MRFFTGLHQPSDAKHFDAAFVSVNRLRKRKSAFDVGDWIMDSGAFTEISTHGQYRHGVDEYAAQIRRWATNGSGRLLAAVAQDWMCEPWIVEKTGWTVEIHQRVTVVRYDDLLAEDVAGIYILPVLQGYAPADYVRHLGMYGDRLKHGAWVGVGSVCKRNGDPRKIAEVLLAIKQVRPDLRLHGFGLKTTALADPLVRSMLHTADSMAWSFHARINGRNGNDWREAIRWTRNIASRPVQQIFDLWCRAARAALNFYRGIRAMQKQLAAQLCAINTLPPSLVRGWLLVMFDLSHAAQCAGSVDEAQSRVLAGGRIPIPKSLGGGA